MKLWIPYGAMPVPPRPVSAAIEAMLQHMRKDSRWRRGALGTFILFACSYALVIFLSGPSDCSSSSFASYNSGEVESAYCRFASWSGAFRSSTALESGLDITAPERNVSQGWDTRTSIDRIVFGIGANEGSWAERREYIKLWWKPGVTRGFVWVDQNLTSWREEDPPFKVSEDTSRFGYTHSSDSRSALRISRIVAESFRLGLPDVDWFVMGDDDTLFFTENLVKVLSKYDPRGLHYVGMSSEDTRQSERHLYGLAFGGGGFAISYPLAKALSDRQDECLDRYPWLYGSDERVKACASELGVPLTKEPGFHQLDMHGDISGYLAAHPVAPIVSLHHLGDIDPIFYGSTQLEASKRLMKAVAVDPSSMFQQSICYDSELRWSVSVSWGYVVEVYEGFVAPRELEMPARTFVSWAWIGEFGGFTTDTRLLADTCDRPTRFFMVTAGTKGKGRKKVGTSSYARLTEFEQEGCRAKTAPMNTVKSVSVENEPFADDWYRNPQRHCCSVTHMDSKSINIQVGACGESESLVKGAKPEETKKKTRRLLAE